MLVKQKTAKICKCGCGQVTKQQRNGRWNTYCDGHRGVGITKPPLGSEPSVCQCGECNEKVTWDKGKCRWRKYVKGHVKKIRGRGLAPSCACGCNQKVGHRKDGRWRMYVQGHKSAGKTKPPIGVVPPLCQCGECTEHVTWNPGKQAWNKYAKDGHNSKTLQGRERARKQMESNWQDPAFQEMRSRVAKEQFSTPEARQASSDRLKKLHEDPAFSKNNATVAREMCIERWQDDGFRNMMTEQARQTMTKNNQDWWQDETFRDNRSKKMSKRMKEQWADPDYREQRCIEQVKAWDNPERRKAMSERQIALWKDPEHVEKMMIAQGRRPNGLETLFDDLTIDKIAYVGDGTFFKTWPNGRIKNPDFKVKDRKLIIELFGDYFHQGDDVQLHMEMWHRIGYEVLILWESEIHDSQSEILDIVSTFIGEDARSVA